MRDGAHLGDVGPADAVLHRPADRRAELERVDARDQARELVGQQRSRASSAAARGPPRPWRRSPTWLKKSFGQLRVQRQVEADRAAADIGAPALDVRIVLQRRVEAAPTRPRSHRSRRSAAGAGRPAAPAGRRPGRTAAAPAAAPASRATNRPSVTPIVTQRACIAASSRRRKRAVDAARLRPSAAGFGGFRIATPSTGAKTTATNHDTTSAMLTTANSEKVYSPAELAAKPIGHEAGDRHERAGQHGHGVVREGEGRRLLLGVARRPAASSSRPSSSWRRRRAAPAR